ncbi:hypothetical protein CAEBREN_29224 [Caenorhabditis brenneri]|uniref:DNA2/NAM7 helicase-like C-terminal domain-containing protein n=1 Tax=Caenorhabditis brenneri TaxID=135651 RepID=G0NMM0_CAEBE|nr:hypothetical protein CAEBREN_29224 [Caenorhabditis brenneri]
MTPEMRQGIFRNSNNRPKKLGLRTSNTQTTTRPTLKSSTSSSSDTSNASAVTSSSTCSTATTQHAPILDPFNPDVETVKEYTEEDFEKAKKARDEVFEKLDPETKELVLKSDFEALVKTKLFQERMNVNMDDWKHEDADHRIEPTEGRFQQCNELEKVVTETDNSLKDVGDDYEREKVREPVFRKDCENYQWYTTPNPNEELPKDKVLNLIASETPKRVALFIRHFNSQQDAVPERLENNPKNETVYSTTPPSDRSVLYMAVEHRGGSFLLTPIHLEIVGGCRPSLHYITLTATSYDLASKKFFNMKEIEIGDVFIVETIVPHQQKHKEPVTMLTDMEHVSDPARNRFWRVLYAVRVPRTVSKQKLAHHWIPNKSTQTNAYLVEDLVYPALLSSSIAPEKGKHRARWLEVTVMTPPVQPGRNLRGFNPGPDEEEDALDLFRPHNPVWTISPRIIESKKLAGELLDLVNQGVKQFKQDGQLPDESFQKAARLIRLGAYAQQAMVNFRYDPRSYTGQVTEASESQFGYTLDVNLKNPIAFPIQVIHWRANTMVIVRRSETTIPARVVSVMDYKDGRFRVIARLAKRFSMDLDYYKDRKIFVQHKIQDSEDHLRMQIGKMVPPEYNTSMKAMRVWAATLGADKITDPEEHRNETPYEQGDFTSTSQQGRVLEYMDDDRIPGCIVHCAFGAGKTTTLVTSLLHHSEAHPKRLLAFTAQSNTAVVQAVHTWEKWDPRRNVKAVRVMTAANRDRLDHNQHTCIDLPVLLWQVLKLDFDHFNFPNLPQSQLNISVTRHLEANKRIAFREISSRELRAACRASYRKDPPVHGLHECFMRLYKPTLFFGTTTSLRQIFSTNDYMNNLKEKIKIICVDESSQLPRAAFTALVFTFPKARLFLTGDSRQLPPYEETKTPEDLSRFAGAWFQNAFDNKVLPIVSISRVFRCPPYITRWLSQCFYQNTLTSARARGWQYTALNRLGFTSRSPLQFVNTVSEETKEGTSARNLKEAVICDKLVRQLLPLVGGKNIAVVCFYLSQVSLLSGILPQGVHVTSVDGVQGSEYQYVIVCTTRSMDFTKSKFMNSKERTNVALSRSTRATVVLINLAATHGAEDCWDLIVNKVPEEARFNVRNLEWLNPAAHEVNRLEDTLRVAEYDDQWIGDQGVFSPRR